MARTISQQTFDNAVEENMEEFSMSTDEAIKDAIKQFESQGVSLQNIVTNSLLNSQVEQLTTKIENVKELISENSYDDDQLISLLDDIKKECDESVAKRVLAGQCGLYVALTKLLSDYQSGNTNNGIDENLKSLVLETLIALMTGYPDLLEMTGFNIIRTWLNDRSNETILLLTLKWSVQCCIKHEMNRHMFLADESILSALRNLITTDKISPDVLRTVCKLFQTFVLNDDIRAEIPLAHKHACLLANDFLHPLINLLKSFKNDKKVLVALFQALMSIIVRNEYCQQFADFDGLEILRDILVENLEDETVCRNCFGLIKVVAGNDQVKAKMMQIIDPSILVSVVRKFLHSPNTCTQGLAAMSMLSLRNSANCKLLRENDFAEIVVQAMKIHPSAKKLTKNVCWLIKNLAQGNEKFASDFLAMGTEDCLRDILIKYPDCSFEIKMALRLLGCEVESKEEWTGEGKSLDS